MPLLLGNSPNQVPTNGDLGTLAFQDAANIAGPVGVGGALTLNSGTVNGVTYLNASKALTSGTALVFDGTKLGVNTASPLVPLQVGSGTVASTYSSGISVQHPYNPGLNLLSPAATGVNSGISFADDVLGQLALIKYTNSTKEFSYQNSASGGYQSWYTGGSERMRIDSSGNVGIGTNAPSASAILDAQSTTKGVRMPNMTTTQKNAIASPAAGLMVFDTTLAKLCVYTGAAWQTITSA